MQELQSGHSNLYDYTTVMMGSPIILTLLEPNETLAQKIFQTIRQYEKWFTVNAPISQVMAINQAAGRHFVAVHPQVYALIAYAKAMSLLESSGFNVTIGPLVKLWKIGFGGDTIPSSEAIQTVLRKIQPEKVYLKEAECQVMLAEAGMQLDLGAIAKGFIADRVRDYLQQWGVECALINLGGNVQTLGAPAEGWQIGIKKPYTESEVLGVVSVRNQAVVTTGVYERYITIGGRSYHHILNPTTGYPIETDLLSVTVVNDAAVVADVWGTILFARGLQASQALLETKALKNIGLAAILISKDYEVVCSGIEFQSTG